MQRKLNEVFIDPESGKRLKCVEAKEDECNDCVYLPLYVCNSIKCADSERNDGKNVIFVETDEPLTE